MREEHLQSKRAGSSPGLMPLAGHLTLDRGQHVQHGRRGSVVRGWTFPRKDLASLSLCLSLSLLPSPLPFSSSPVPRYPPRYRTQVYWPHPNNVRPLARSGQCLASPAQSPAASPPHPPFRPH